MLKYILLLLAAATVHATGVAWSPGDSSAAGYNLYYTTTPGLLVNGGSPAGSKVNVGNSTNAAVQLAAGSTYFMGVTAVNAAGESVLSNVVTATAAPVPIPGDDRIGFSTHFDQQDNPTWEMPLIAATGAGWIRDDGNWGLDEPTQGAYVLNPAKQVWIDSAHSYGLKVVWILHGNRIYADPYDPTAAAAFCAWLAQAESARLGAGNFAIEVVNEPNNVTEFKGRTGFQAYITLVNAIYSAVKAVSPSTPVIGCGFQGDEVLACLKAGATVDGTDPHPYDNGDHIPEHVYEPSFTQFVPFIAALHAAGKQQIWTTEQGCSDGSRTSVSEYPAAVWQARRLLLSLGEGVDHTFLYTFTNLDFAQATVSHYGNLEQSYFMLQRLIPPLQGLVTQHKKVTLSNQSAGFDTADFYSEVFAVKGGRTVSAVWLGNNVPSSGQEPLSGTCSVTIPLQRHHYWRQSVVLNVITGDTQFVLEATDKNPSGLPQWSASGSTINNITVSSRPVLLITP